MTENVKNSDIIRNMEQNIAKNLKNIRRQIDDSCLQEQRKEHSVCLIAVSKGHAIQSIRSAIAAGQRDFGENYLQDAVPKIKALHNPKDAPSSSPTSQPIWHYIGQIQSNKTKSIAQHFDWCHSLDSLKHAKRLNKHRAESNKQGDKQDALNICVQVQLEDRTDRGGIQFHQSETFIAELLEYSHLSVRGLMCVMPEGLKGKELNDAYALLNTHFKSLQATYPQLDTLSAGMSGDYQQAIAHGSTMVRIGTAIFGPR